MSEMGDVDRYSKRSIYIKSRQWFWTDTAIALSKIDGYNWNMVFVSDKMLVILPLSA